MKPRISIITLAVDNLERSLRFYRDGLGLPTEGITDDHVAFFLEGELALVLYPRAEIAKIANQAEAKPHGVHLELYGRWQRRGRGYS